MKYTKALNCDFCDRIELSNARTWQRLKKKLYWIEYWFDGLAYDFCCPECLENFKQIKLPPKALEEIYGSETAIKKATK